MGIDRPTGASRLGSSAAIAGLLAAVAAAIAAAGMLGATLPVATGPGVDLRSVVDDGERVG